MVSGREGPMPTPELVIEGPRAQDDEDADPFLNLVCAVAEYAHESVSGVLAWPWRLFCAMASRMIRYMYDERKRREAQEEQREMDAEERALRERHAATVGRM